MSSHICQNCDEEDDQFRTCNHCRKLFCSGCVTWCHADGDEQNGDFFCQRCIEELAAVVQTESKGEK